MPRPIHLFRATVCFVLIVIGYLSFDGLKSRHERYGLTTHAHSVSDKLSDHVLGNPEYIANFAHDLVTALHDNAPNVSPIRRLDDDPGLIFWRATGETSRPDLLNITLQDVESMRLSHAAYLQQARQTMLPFDRGISGIVSSASGKYLPVFMISLNMLRRSGCNQPIELFVDTEEELQSDLCTTYLPEKNARCLRLQDVLGSWTKDLVGFQIKTFTILASSFENVLFLDADVILTKDVAHIFTKKPFTSTGLVTWPDFWASSASPHLFNIINIKAPSMNVLASTESGQLLVSKKSHKLTLLLAAYYNYYGPSHYYPLISQGGPGEGDKDTFITAARAAKEPFYQVKKCVDTIGYYEDGQYHGGAMLQYDPTQDSKGSAPNVASMYPMPDAFSVHHNIPKYDPVELFGLGIAVNAKTGKPHRIITTDNLGGPRFDRDIERELWEEIQFVTCELGDQGQIPGWKTVPTVGDEKGTCDMIKWYRSEVFGQ